MRRSEVETEWGAYGDTKGAIEVEYGAYEEISAILPLHIRIWVLIKRLTRKDRLFFSVK
jgi:hypothetical protein